MVLNPQALSSYAYTASGIGMSSKPTIDEFTSAGDDFCMKTYDEVYMGIIKYCSVK